jgi:hypothetical protein|tara:strand:+ start:32 stop:178 length:147 start_codon:yes stop_codon:yes gene_type:complete
MGQAAVRQIMGVGTVTVAKAKRDQVQDNPAQALSMTEIVIKMTMKMPA